MGYFIVIDKNKFSSPPINSSEEERFRQANRKRPEGDKWEFKMFETEEDAIAFKTKKVAKYPAVKPKEQAAPPPAKPIEHFEASDKKSTPVTVGKSKSKKGK